MLWDQDLAKPEQIHYQRYSGAPSPASVPVFDPPIDIEKTPGMKSPIGAKPIGALPGRAQSLQWLQYLRSVLAPFATTHIGQVPEKVGLAVR